MVMTHTCKNQYQCRPKLFQKIMETDVRTDTTDCSRPTRSIIIRPHHRRGLLVRMSHVPWSVLGARMDCAKTEEPIVSQFGRV